MVITMSNKFWLIQRGKIRPTFEDATEFLSGRKDALVDPAYMGAAEFEWGAIPKAFVRLMDMMSKYEDNLVQVIQATDLKNIQGKTIWLVCDPARREVVISAIKDYIENPYPLKEYSHLPEHFQKEQGRFRSYALEQTDFWWCIDRCRDYQSEEFVGDWIAFIGERGVPAKLTQILNNDLRNWWMAFDEATRAQKLKDAHRYP